MSVKLPDTVEEHTIILQVERICRSSEFSSKRLLCKFLSYVVSEFLAGRGDLIKGYSIGVDVFSKGEDFDPGEDALVRIHAGRLRRMLDLYYLKEGGNDPVRIEIPKGGYSPVISPMTHSHSNDNFEADLKKKGVSRFHPRVAVLPFRNLTGELAKDYFAMGFSEELSVELANYEDLTVYSCSTCKAADGDQAKLKEAYLENGIRFILEGCVMQASTQVRVLVKLIDIDQKIQLWAKSYSMVMTVANLNTIQATISKEIAQVVGSEYGILIRRLSLDARQIKPQMLDTYSAKLKYYYFIGHQTPEAAGEAFSALQEALKKEPGSAITMALLASLHGNRYSLDRPDAAKSYQEMGRLAEEAALIDPNNATVIASMIFKCFIYNEEERFVNLVNQFLSHFNRSSFKLASVAFHLSLFGDWERGKKLLDQIFQICHGFPSYLYGATSLYHYRMDNYEQALIQARHYDTPTLFWGPLLRAATLGQLNKIKDAEVNVGHLLKLKPDFETKAGYLISRFVKEPALMTKVMDGLFKAGMKL